MSTRHLRVGSIVVGDLNSYVFEDGVIHVRQSNGVIAYIDPKYFVIKECDENGYEKV